VIAKPTSEVFESAGESRRQFIQQLRNVARVGVVGIRGSSDSEPTRSDRPRSAHPTNLQYARVIAIGASTGGPPCVRKVLSEIDAEHSPPIVVTQHMSAQFLLGFAQWLNSTVTLPVELARHDTPLEPGHVYVAPGEHHLEIQGDGRISLSSAAPVGFHRPSVDVMFRAVARSYGADAVAVLLTGMGADGAQGMKDLHDLGALTIAQDEESSLVYGMPAAACQLNAARLSANPNHIGRLLRRVRMGAQDDAVTVRPAADGQATQLLGKGSS